MANVTFDNMTGLFIYLHMRIGPVDTSPDDRGTQNTTLNSGEKIEVPVGDGDVWYCYGTQPVNTSHQNPQLCNVKGNATATLDGESICFVKPNS